jgi:hypothetical protein
MKWFGSIQLATSRRAFAPGWLGQKYLSMPTTVTIRSGEWDFMVRGQGISGESGPHWREKF